MKISLARLFVVFVLISSLLPGAVYAATLSEREAKRVIEEGFGRPGDLLLGSYAVGGGMAEAVERRPTNLRQRYLASDDLKKLKVWASMGVISIKSAKTLDEEKDFNWKDFMSYTQQGIAEYVVISPTEKGLRIGKTKHIGDIEVLLVPDTTKYEITKMHKIDDKKYGTDEYKVVYISYNAPYDQTHLEWQTAAGVKYAYKQKAIVLLKYDPFKEVWSMVTLDHADSEKDFATRNVESALRRVQQ